MYASKLVYNLLNKSSFDYLQKIFIKKFEDYEKVVNKYRINDKIYWNYGNSLNQTRLGEIASMVNLSSAPAVVPNL